VKYALIIGNEKYSDPRLAQLKTPASDSQALARTLADKNVGAFDEVKPLINKTETEARRAIGEFLTNRKPDDLVLIYFSGHGVLDDRGRLYLALKDTQTSLLKATAIPSTYVSDEMDSCRSKRQVLILDCCHSGAFARGTKGDQKAVTEATFEGSGYGRVVMTASDSTQFALEGDQVIEGATLSLFTHFLLEGLKTGEADLDQDGHISLDEWYDYTYSRVLAETPRQIPHKWSYNQQGDVMIAQNPNLKKKVAELPLELQQALESSFVGIRESAVIELGRYLRARDPAMIDLAIVHLEKMKGDDSRRISSAAEKALAEFGQIQAPVNNAARASIAATKYDAPLQDVQPKVSRVTDTIIEKAGTPFPVSTRPALNNSFWPKWSAAILPAILFSTMFYFYNLPADIDAVKFVGLFMTVTGLSSAIQWFTFREKLKVSWVAANLAAGLALGSLHIYLYSQSEDWWGIHLSVLLSLWALGNFGFGSMLIKDSQTVSQKPSIIENVGGPNAFLILLSASLILGAISNVLLVWDLSHEALRTCWMLYGAAAILTGLSFILNKEIPRNIGFITLVIFLAVDGFNVERLAFEAEFPYYVFAINGVFGFLPSIFFALQKATWKNLGFSLLVGNIIATNLAGLAIYNSDLAGIFLIISSIFAVPAAIFFLVGMRSVPGRPAGKS